MKKSARRKPPDVRAEKQNALLAKVGWGLALLLAVFAINFGRQLSGDVYWHIKAGEWILKHRAFPFHDPFSYTASHDWILQEWAFQVIAWLISRISLDLLAWLSFGALAAALAVTYATSLKQASPRAAFVITAVAAGVCADMVDMRPQVFGLLAFAVLVAALEKSSRAGKGFPLWLPLLFVAWANFHSSFTAGLVLLLVECGAVFYLALRQPDLSGRFAQPVRNLAVTAACALAALINPNGWRLYTFPLRTVGHGGMTSIIAEWVSPDFRSLAGASLGIFILILIWGLARRERQASTASIARIIVFLSAALVARRLAPFFALACAPAVAGLIAPSLEEMLKSRRMALAAAALAITLLIAGAAFRISDIRGRGAFEYISTQEAFPDRACDFILRENPPGPMFNELNYGSYLIWRLWPRYKVFVDNRNDIFYGGAFDEFMRAAMAGGNSAWRQVFDRRGINLVVLVPNSLLADVLTETPDWQMIYSDDKAVVFSRSR